MTGEYFSLNRFMKKIHEDDFFEVYVLPSDNTIMKLLTEYIRDKSIVTSKEIREKFKNVVGEYKLKKLLNELVEKKIIRRLSNGKYYVYNGVSP